MVIRTLFICTLSCLLSGTVGAQEVKLKKGQEFILESEQNVETGIASSSVHLYNAFAFKVTGTDPAGNYLLECRLLAFRQNDKSNGGAVIFDSDSIRNTKFNSTTALEKIAILQRPFSVTLSRKGEVRGVSGVEEMIVEAVEKWQIDQETADMLIENTSAYQDVMRGLFFRLPDGKKFKEGVEWVVTDSTHTQNAKLYTVEESAKEYLVISSDVGKFKLERKTMLPLAFETSLSDTATGMQSSGKVRRLSMYKAAPEIDTAWVNMAVLSSYWSAALKNKVDFDSLKVAAFIERYDKLFANDPFYRGKALTLLQWTNAHEEYRRSLKNVPNSLLINESSHLYNKLQNLYDSDIQGAFDIIRILDQYHPKTLYDWIQYTFSESFLRDQTAGEEKNTAGLLLDMCMNDPDQSLRRQFAPLHLWVSAKTGKERKSALEQALAGVRQMDAGYWKEGNLGRYALITYNLLSEAGDSASASKLLDHILVKLGSAVDDSLNRQRLTHRNMLAHAYFLKYRELLAADSLAALEYLEKAAHYSPKNSAGQAYGSSYDRMYLNSRESYQEDYMKALSRLGRTKEALNTLVAEFNANLAILPRLKAYYESSNPGKDFNTFFAKEVVNNWDEAPSFTLQNMADQPVSLKNYAGKWLVLDFWGTWCGPCKEEMPELNAFYQEVKKGAVPGVDFLSIACYDTKGKVIDYLALNNFDLPAVLSDGKVQIQYKVQGYPTKILISPNGKMKMLSGRNWRSLVEQFARIYPGSGEKDI